MNKFEPKPYISKTGDKTSNSLSRTLNAEFDRIISDTPDHLPALIQEMTGMSGRKYRTLINRIVKGVNNPRYLEIGSWMGSTLCAAIYNNSVTSLAIDNWSEFGGPVSDFYRNLSLCTSSTNPVSVLNSDFKQVNYQLFSDFNVYLFDGPHSFQDQFDALKMVLPALSNSFILIIDDWNWQDVRDGTEEAIEKTSLKMLFRIEIRTTLNGKHPGEIGMNSCQDSDWHNGYLIAVLEK